MITEAIFQRLDPLFAHIARRMSTPLADDLLQAMWYSLVVLDDAAFDELMRQPDSQIAAWVRHHGARPLLLKEVRRQADELLDEIAADIVATLPMRHPRQRATSKDVRQVPSDFDLEETEWRALLAYAAKVAAAYNLQLEPLDVPDTREIRRYVAGFTSRELGRRAYQRAQRALAQLAD